MTVRPQRCDHFGTRINELTLRGVHISVFFSINGSYGKSSLRQVFSLRGFTVWQKERRMKFQCKASAL